MKNMGTQIGTADQADFEEGTWTFKMPDGFKVRAGEFAIVDKQNYYEAMVYLQRLRKFVSYTENKEQEIELTALIKKLEEPQ